MESRSIPAGIYLLKVNNRDTRTTLSYRNQSVDLKSKSTDWFLYDGNTGR